MTTRTHLTTVVLSIGVVASQVLAQTTPPTVTFTTPSGIQRGTGQHLSWRARVWPVQR